MKKRVLAILLIIALLFSYAPETTLNVQAATHKVKLSKKKVTMRVGKTKTIKLKNVKSKVKWKVIKGKKVVSIKKKGKYKNKIKIKAKRIGSAKIRAKYKGKKFIVRVKVKKKTEGTIPEEPATAEPIIPQINGNTYFKLTPDIAGSVTPR